MGRTKTPTPAAVAAASTTMRGLPPCPLRRTASRRTSGFSAGGTSRTEQSRRVVRPPSPPQPAPAVRRARKALPVPFLTIRGACFFATSSRAGVLLLRRLSRLPPRLPRPRSGGKAPRRVRGIHGGIRGLPHRRPHRRRRRGRRRSQQLQQEGGGARPPAAPGRLRVPPASQLRAAVHLPGGFCGAVQPRGGGLGQPLEPAAAGGGAPPRPQGSACWIACCGL